MSQERLKPLRYVPVDDPKLEVVLFSGGRGSGVLSKELIARPEIRLTIAINGYDDGLSTGEVRRLLGDCLGPSDFRKNASRMARALGSCPAEIVDALDRRLPDPATGEDAETCLTGLGDDSARRLKQRLHHFEQERTAAAFDFNYADCSVGNLVFAGGFLLRGRDFNRAVDDYCALLGLAPGLVENVTDGTNAYLVAVDRNGKLLPGEAEIVDADEPSYVEDIFLLDRAPTREEVRSLDGEPEKLRAFLEARRCEVRPNPRLLERLAAADLVIYAPGTQHSSLFPSYLTPGLGPAVARNWKAIKVLVTNLRQDAEIPDASALDIVGKALYYLREKDRHALPSRASPSFSAPASEPIPAIAATPSAIQAMNMEKPLAPARKSRSARRRTSGRNRNRRRGPAHASRVVSLICAPGPVSLPPTIGRLASGMSCRNAQPARRHG